MALATCITHLYNMVGLPGFFLGSQLVYLLIKDIQEDFPTRNKSCFRIGDLGPKSGMQHPGCSISLASDRLFKAVITPIVAGKRLRAQRKP